MPKTTYAVRLCRPDYRVAVVRCLCQRDPGLTMDPQSNPVTIWVTTCLSAHQIECVLGVEQAVRASTQEPVYA